MDCNEKFNPDFFAAKLEQVLSSLRQEIEQSLPSPSFAEMGEELDN